VKIEKLAIANRGEVAVRIIRAAQELGISTALLHSEADVKTLAYRLADERVLIGSSPAPESYLHIERNVLAAKGVGADAIHPGFGFLSENADFAEACAEARIRFVGPRPETIRLFGDKISSKELVKKTGGATIPGYQGDLQDVVALRAEAARIGYPVIVKAAAGGGGRGMRIIRTDEEAVSAIEAARSEAKNAFGSEKLFLEKYLDRAKHVEVQVFGEASGRVHVLSERECSVQRRHQKIIEEAPAAQLDPFLRVKILKTAQEIAETARYLGAGTVEFLVQDSEFYFMEMNTRLQVEHPATEMILGLDLVKAQIMTAQDQALFWDGLDAQPRGHAIECRIYAEDPYAGGVPSVGRLGGIHFPQGPGRRFEFGFEPGDVVTSFYDSMIAKVIVHDESRKRALKKMQRTLADTIIFGVKTNIPYLLAILSHPEFSSGTMTTQFVEKNFPKGLPARRAEPSDLKLARTVAGRVGATAGSVGDGQDTLPNPWIKL
jgi:acetyl/propionyl-CoA carboxylase alpha subunit